VSFGVPQAEAGGGADAAGAADVPVWRVRLPADLSLADEYLRQGEQQAHHTDQWLVDAERRLHTLADALATQQVQPQQVGRGAEVAFGVPGQAAPAPLPAPEQELLRMLSVDGGDDSAVSFALEGEEGRGDTDTPQDSDGMQRVQAFLTHVQRVALHYAWIETHIEEVLIGQTAVGWTGDMRTVWNSRYGVESVRLHSRSMHVTLTSRATLIRTVVIVTKGAMRISAAVASGGTLAALPVVWRFVDQVLHEYQQIRNRKEEVA
jgi:hypothetical protein